MLGGVTGTKTSPGLVPAALALLWACSPLVQVVPTIAIQRSTHDLSYKNSKADPLQSPHLVLLGQMLYIAMSSSPFPQPGCNKGFLLQELQSPVLALRGCGGTLHASGSFTSSNENMLSLQRKTVKISLLSTPR